MSAHQKSDLGALRQKLALIERGGRDSPALPFGVPAIDKALPGGGLALGALHEIFGLGAAEEEAAEGAGFAAGIAARLDPPGPVLWCSLRGDLHAPGVAAHGLRPERLVLARARTEAELLWAMEEGLKCRALAGVVGELEGLPLTAGRRLQLAAENAGRPAFVLRRRQRLLGAEAQPSAAVTRWRVAACPSRDAGEPGMGGPLWFLELLRCRGGGMPMRWIVEVADETGHVRLAAALADRAPAPAAEPRAPRRAAG